MRSSSIVRSTSTHFIYTVIIREPPAKSNTAISVAKVLFLVVLFIAFKSHDFYSLLT